MPRDANDPLASPYEIMTGMNMSVALRIDQIEAGRRLRMVDPDKVTALKASIEEIGLRTLIAVTGDRNAHGDPSIKVRLVAGAHRLEAMRQLGREYIGVVFEDGDDLDAELWEIDENLIRADLTPADRALFVFRRKEIYLLKYPETANGGDRRSDRQVGELKQDDKQRFTAATAVATGQSERAIQRDAERGEKISEKALRMLRGTHHDKGVTLDRLKSLRPDEQEIYVGALFAADKTKALEAKELRDNKQKLNRSVRTEIIKAIAEKGTMVAGEMPRAAFAVVYADVPWEQEAYSDETGQDRGLKYPAMPLADIKALCAGDQSPATPDAILFFWATASRLKDALDVMAAWGFTYKSHLIWDKVNIGMGRWVRDRHELLLIGTRGSFPGLIPGTQPHSVHCETKTGHSAKPAWFAAEIDRLFPDLPKLELFQRKDGLHFADVRNGPSWSFWGYEAGRADASEIDVVDGAQDKAQVSTGSDVPAPTEDELVEYKALAAIDGGLTVSGPYFDDLVARGMVFTAGKVELSFDGSARLDQLQAQISAHSDGDMVRCQKPDEPTSLLPPGPGRNAPVEFSVGGMRKGSFARFSVHLNDDATYSIAAEYEIAGYGGGASSRTGTINTFESALRHGLAEIGGKLRPVISDTSSVCASGHKAAARAGVKWIEARMEEWGLGARPVPPARQDAAALETAVAKDQLPDDPVRASILESGLAGNDYLLELNRGFIGNQHATLPSRLLQSPVEFVDRDRTKDGVSRILLRHPLIGEHPDVAPYLAEIEEKTGITPEWHDFDEFGRGRERGGYFHAVDLCTDEHWNDLMATRYLCDLPAIFNGMRFNLEYKNLAVKNARAMMVEMDIPEPEGRSAALLAGDGLWPYQDGKKKYIAPNIKPRGADGVWLVIHGIEDGWLNYVGGFASVTAKGMAWREAAKAAPIASEAAE